MSTSVPAPRTDALPADAAEPGSVATAIPATAPTTAGADGSLDLRPDLADALGALPEGVRAQICGPGASALHFLQTHLPPTESVRSMVTVGVTQDRFDSLLVLTSRRLLFVAPAPQALSWPLPAIAHFQLFAGYHVEGTDGHRFLFEKDPTDDVFNHRFVDQVDEAIAAAVLRLG